MAVLTATEFKSKLGEYMERAQHEPVVVKKGGRRYAVMISEAEYERLQAIEDQYWGERAREAVRRGDYLSPEETMAFIQQRLAQP